MSSWRWSVLSKEIGQIKASFQWVGDAYIFTLTTWCIAIVQVGRGGIQPESFFTLEYVVMLSLMAETCFSWAGHCWELLRYSFQESLLQRRQYWMMTFGIWAKDRSTQMPTCAEWVEYFARFIDFVYNACWVFHLFPYFQVIDEFYLDDNPPRCIYRMGVVGVSDGLLIWQKFEG
jgi:hypothetical protein